MLPLKQKQPETERPQVAAKLRWRVLPGDLMLFVSLLLARFIVWRTLRKRRRERAERLKNLKLVGRGLPSTGSHRVLMPAGMDEKGMLREAARR